jgi:hypothetical protein
MSQLTTEMRREDARDVIPEESRWELEEGDEIAPGRSAIKVLGGGFRYEAYLAWDDHLPIPGNPPSAGPSSSIR